MKFFKSTQITHFYMTIRQSILSLYKQLAKFMIQEQEIQENKYKVTMKKLSFDGWKRYPQTKFHQFECLQRLQTNRFISLIKSNITPGNPLEVIKDCLTALSNVLTTDKKEDFQRGAHLFIPHLLSLLRRKQDFSIVHMIIKYLVRLTSFGNLNEQCVELFRQRGIQSIIKLIQLTQYEKAYGKAEHQYLLFALVANLSIDNVILRDTLIQKDAIEAIILVSQIYQDNPVLERRIQGFKLIALYALMVSELGYQLPDKNWIEQGIKKAMNNMMMIKTAHFQFSSEIIRGALYLFYHYFNYRNQQQCITFLKNFLYLRQKYQSRKDSSLDNHFNIIFKKIYEYYFEKEPEGKVMNILHGCIKQFVGISFPWQVYLQYTPKMYQQLFQAAIKHRPTQIKHMIVSPWKSAISIVVQQEQQPQLQISALKFILWVLDPVELHCGRKYSKKRRQLSGYEQCVIEKELLYEIQVNVIAVSRLRHSSIRTVASIANIIFNKYYQLNYKKQGYKFNIEK